MISNKDRVAQACSMCVAVFSAAVVLLLSGSLCGGRGAERIPEDRSSFFTEIMASADSLEVRDAAERARRNLVDGLGGAELIYFLSMVSTEMCLDGMEPEFPDRVSMSGGCDSLYSTAEAAGRYRRFREAGRIFEKASRIYLSGGDTLSACISLFREIECFILARSLKDAWSGLVQADSLLPKVGCRNTIFLLGKLMEAEYLGGADRINEADSVYRWIVDAGTGDTSDILNLRVQIGRGRLYDKRGLFKEALDCYLDALRITVKLKFKRTEAVVLNNIGLDMIRTGRAAEGRGYLEKALGIADACGEMWILGYVYYGFGSSFESEGDRRVAAEYFNSSVRFHRISGNMWGELASRLRLAYLLMEMGRFDESRKEYDYCAARYEEMNSLYGLSWALGGRAVCLHRSGEFAAAEKDYLRCLRLREKIGDRKGVAWSLRSLGMLYDLSSSYGKALLAYNRALEIYRDIEDESGEGYCLFGLGSSYYYLGRFNRAVGYYEKALDVAARVSGEELEYRVLSGLGSSYIEMGRLRDAEDCYRRSLEIAGRLPNPVSFVWSCNNLASLYVRMGDVIRARAFLELASSRAGTGSMDYLRAQTLYIGSMVERSSSGRAEKLERAVEIARKRPLPGILWKALCDLGSVRLEEGRREEAIELEEEAVVEVEKMVKELGYHEGRRSMLEVSFLPFRRLVDYLLSGGERTVETVYRAIDVVERSRVLAVEMLLGGGAVSGEGGSSPRKDLLLSRLSYLQYILQDPRLGDMERRDVVSEIEDCERRLETLSLEPGSNESEESNELLQGRIEDVLAELRDDEVVLSYFLTEGRTYLFRVRRDSVRVFILKPPGRIDELVRHYIDVLKGTGGIAAGEGSYSSEPRQGARQSEKGGPRGERWSGDGLPHPPSSIDDKVPPGVFVDVSREVHRELVGAALDGLKGVRRLVIVPDGVLNRLPFATLYGRDGFLIERYSIITVPSVRSLIRLRERSKAAVESPPEYQMLSFGCIGSGLGGGDSAVRLFPFDRVPVRPLIDAEVEAIRVAGFFGRSSAFTGRFASESAFKKSPLGDACMIHIASHTYVDDSDARRSFIVTNRTSIDEVARATDYTAGSSPGGCSLEDGVLQWDEIVNLKLKSLLVTLSGCRSAGGIITSGEGVSGLSQAFLHAGSGAVLAALLDVPDDLASKFMMYFYDAVSRGVGFDEGLRLAQLKALADEELSMPAVWGAFVLLGAGDLGMDVLEADVSGRRLSSIQATALVLAALLVLLILYRWFFGRFRRRYS